MSLPNGSEQTSDGLYAVNGTMDLSAWNIEQKKIIHLDGEWQFYWNRLISPEEFQLEDPMPSGFMQVPGLWNGKEIDGKILPPFGCATYRLILNHTPASKVLGLKKGNARFSSKVFVNGHELISDGIPASQAQDYKSGNTPKLGFFQNDSESIEIIVQVANFEYMNSGIPVSLELGREDAMLYQHQKNNMLALAVFAILWTIAFLYLIFFVVALIKGVKEYILPLFSLFCFLFAIGNGMADQRPLLFFVPDISFTVAFKMKDFFLSANFITLLWVFHRFKNGLLPLYPVRIISIMYGFYLLAVVVLPIHVYYEIHQVVMICNTVILLALLVQAIHLYIKEAKGLLLFVSVLTVNMYSIDSILFSLGLKASSRFSQVFMMLFAVVMILLLSMHYLTAITQLQTSVLRTQEAEIAFLRAQINPHFLYNALNSIAALCATAPERAEDVVVELSQYLRRSFDFKRIDAMTTLGKEVELLEAYLYIEKTRFGDRLEVEYDIDETLNIPIPPLILQPLVENAVRHGLMNNVAGGTVTISIRRQQGEAVFTIEDNGVGIEAARISELLEEKPKSGGIGMWNINQRLKMLYNRGLTVYSVIGGGTRITFCLPLDKEKKTGRIRRLRGGSQK